MVAGVDTEKDEEAESKTLKLLRFMKNCREDFKPMVNIIPDTNRI